MVKTLSVYDVARYFLARQDPSAEPMSDKKLQKLVYLAQGTTLAMLHRSLWDTTALGARVTAWEQGPVVPILWRRYGAAQWRPLPKPNDVDLSAYDPASRAVMDAVIEKYGHLSADELASLTHHHEPWVRAWERAKINPNDDLIPDSELEDYFARVWTGHDRPVSLDQLSAAHPEWAEEDARAAAEIDAGQGLSLGELRRFLGL